MKLSDFVEKPYPENWPPKEYYVPESALKAVDVEGLRVLVEQNAGEKKLDAYISEHPILLTALLDFDNTGHHAAWVVPKKAIRSKISSEMPGLIPDFLVGGKNSFSITWYVVELKGAEHSLFTKSGNGLCLSSVANRGLCQVLEYMHYCNTAQAKLRDELKLHGFSSPKAFVFIGRKTDTVTQRAVDLKTALNTMNNRLQIRSYDALLKCCERILGSNPEA